MQIFHVFPYWKEESIWIIQKCLEKLLKFHSKAKLLPFFTNKLTWIYLTIVYIPISANMCKISIPDTQSYSEQRITESIRYWKFRKWMKYSQKLRKMSKCFLNKDITASIVICMRIEMKLLEYKGATCSDPFIFKQALWKNCSFLMYYTLHYVIVLQNVRSNFIRIISITEAKLFMNKRMMENRKVQAHTSFKFLYLH